MAPMLERLAAEYQTPDQKQIFIEATGSLTGIAALIQNECDMADANIQIVLRQTASGTCRMWEQRILNGASPAPGHIQVFSNSGVLAAVAENRYAIGYISQAYLNHEVKPVEITGHDSETALERTLFLYVNPDRMSKAVKSFLTYLHSGPARKMIRDSGFVPITHDN
jgi:phosphate transport system substrate-binding protein